MSEIEKLENIDYEITDEVIERKWAEVFAKRYRLLQLSDWTQLLDCEISKIERNLWLNWRRKVRAVKKERYFNPDDAMNTLESLELQIPSKIEDFSQIPLTKDTTVESNDTKLKDYLDDVVNNQIVPKIITVDDILKIVGDKTEATVKVMIDFINEKIEKLKINSIPIKKVITEDFEKSKENLKQELKSYYKFKKDNLKSKNDSELYEDLIEYLENGIVNNLLKLYCKKSKLGLEEAVQQLSKERKQYYKDLCELEEFYIDFLDNINFVNLKDFPNTAFDELTKLYSLLLKD